MIMEDERRLEGGNATDRVVRVGSTVRKPWTASTAAIVEYVTELGIKGVDVPAPLGRDEHGRQIIEFIPGRLAMDADPLTLRELARVGRMIRSIHDASEGFAPTEPIEWDVLIPAEGPDRTHPFICHGDLAPWNLIVGERWVFIDWDGAGPSTRLWDLAYAAQAFTLNDMSIDPMIAATRLAAPVDGYRPDGRIRDALPRAMGDRAEAMHDLLAASARSEREPWGSMYQDGHGEHWANATRFAKQHVRIWADALSADGSATDL